MKKPNSGDGDITLTIPLPVMKTGLTRSKNNNCNSYG